MTMQVYVTDCSIDDGISVFNEDGHFIKKISCNKPFAIGIAPDDYILITTLTVSLLYSTLPMSSLLNLKYVVKKKDNLI